jgi:hypothetical protein
MKIDFPKVLLKKLGEEIKQTEPVSLAIKDFLVTLWPQVSLAILF